jgi:phosphoglycolate phosphatase-like HAD superfamily hydrolase
MMPVQVLLWDFGDTLVDETWMRRAPVGYPEWLSAWADVMRSHGDDWNVGRVSERDIFRALTSRAGLTEAEIERHAAACCGSIRFHPFAWRVATERRRPQALVTVNPDLFVERVAKAYDLERYFDAVVVSCREGTDDKVKLCEIALDRIGSDSPRQTALLIDNRRDLTDAWERTGGAAYWYRDDASFEADVPTLLS